MEISCVWRVSNSPACGIFVFEGLADQLAESEGIAVCTEKMPPLCMGCFFRFDIQGFAFQITCQTLIRHGEGNDCFGITFMQSQCKRF